MKISMKTLLFGISICTSSILFANNDVLTLDEIIITEKILKTKPTTKFFECNLKLYFDGLMKVVNEDSLLIIPKTKAFFKEKKTKNGITTFIGTVETYDAFTTKKILALNVTIESYYCKKTKKHIPLFRFSPKDFKHKSWDMLNQARLSANICNN